MRHVIFKPNWLAVLFLASAVSVQAAGEEMFSAPEEAVQALKTAAMAKDTNSLSQIFGPSLHSLVSADAVQASNHLAQLSQRMGEKVALTNEASGRITLLLGQDGWPFPIPLVRRQSHWMFDTDAGRQEIVNRRIGEDEMGAIAVCHGYVQAQREYAGRQRQSDGVLQYAQHLRSSPGRHDGLYWHVDTNEEASPLGPLITEAKEEGYSQTNKIMALPQKPYHGYYFKVLTRQGSHAAGGKYNYVINGHMIAGFALVAWPAVWDNSGAMTFIVNQEGKVFEKNLGRGTFHKAAKMTVYDPDSTWMPVREP